MGCPLPPYIKELGGRRPTKEEGAPRGESCSHLEEDSSFPSRSMRRGKGRREEEGKGAPPPSLSNSD